MRVVVRVLIAVMAVVVLFVGCKKKEAQPVPNVSTKPAMQQHGAPGEGHQAKPELTVVVPDSVKGKWKQIKLAVEDKTSKKSSDYTINLGSDFDIPGSGLRIHVGDLLPDFKMNGSNITSSSNDPNNPAVNVEIFEGGKSVFKGWLYVKFPTIHPFEHPKYAVTMKDAIKS
jgi:hypothetical protein